MLKSYFGIYAVNRLALTYFMSFHARLLQWLGLDASIAHYLITWSFLYIKVKMHANIFRTIIANVTFTISTEWTEHVKLITTCVFVHTEFLDPRTSRYRGILGQHSFGLNRRKPWSAEPYILLFLFRLTGHEGIIVQRLLLLRTNNLVLGNWRFTWSAWKYSKGSSPDGITKKSWLSMKVVWNWVLMSFKALLQIR